MFIILSFYKLLVLYTLQLSHTTVHVSRNTKMYYQPLQPRMKFINWSCIEISCFPQCVFRVPHSTVAYIVSPSMPSVFFSCLSHLEENVRLLGRGGLASCSGASLLPLLFLPLNGSVSEVSGVRFCRCLLSS